MCSFARRTPVLVGLARRGSARVGPPRFGGRRLRRRARPSKRAATSAGSPASTSARLGGVVEADERVGDDEAALRQVRPGAWERHGRLELGDVVVAEVADDRTARRDLAARPPRRSRARAPVPTRLCRPSRPFSTDSSRKPARSPARSRRYAPSGVIRSAWMSGVTVMANEKDPPGVYERSGRVPSLWASRRRSRSARGARPTRCGREVSSERSVGDSGALASSARGRDPVLARIITADGAASDPAGGRGRPRALAPDGLLPAAPRHPAHHLAHSLEHRRLLRGDPQLVHRALHRPAPRGLARVLRGLRPVRDPRLRLPPARREPVPGVHRHARDYPSTSRSTRPRRSPLEDRLPAPPGIPARFSSPLPSSAGGAPAVAQARRPTARRSTTTGAGRRVSPSRSHSSPGSSAWCEPGCPTVSGTPRVRAALYGADLRLPALPHRPVPDTAIRGKIPRPLRRRRDRLVMLGGRGPPRRSR